MKCLGFQKIHGKKTRLLWNTWHIALPARPDRKLGILVLLGKIEKTTTTNKAKPIFE
jgi:hypothetical protein